MARWREVETFVRVRCAGSGVASRTTTAVLLCGLLQIQRIDSQPSHAACVIIPH